MKKKHYINIAFHNFKIKCARKEPERIFQIANFNYKVQNCKLHQNKIFDVLSLFWNRTSFRD